MPEKAAPYKHCMNCGTVVDAKVAVAAADPNVIYCRYSGDRLVNSKCPNRDCPLYDQLQKLVAVAAPSPGAKSQR